ncbi:MAG: hypothetical protein VX278_20955, partial [Myxococcota bacterium]|nr:hypothetical protein [Myxococcota bacterium]
YTLRSMRKAALSGAERKSIAFLQTKPQLLRDILKLLPLPKADVNSFVWILKEIGLLSFERPSDVQKSKPAQKKVDPTKRIHQKIMEIERGTFFDVLELHWICVSQEIEKSYQALHAQFQSFGSRPEVPLILSGLKEAYEELKDTDVRREYRAKLFHQQILLQAATELASHAESAIQKKDKTLACLCYSKALELCPAEQGFRDGLKRAALS